MLEKSPCSLVCATVQDDTVESWSSYGKVPLAWQCYGRSVAVQTMWSYSRNCHPFGSVLIRTRVAQSCSRVIAIGNEARVDGVSP
jgi:hypothetical protein